MAVLDKFLIVGDSFTSGLKTFWMNDWTTKYGKDIKFHSKIGRTAYELKTLIEKKTDFPKESEINGVVLQIGINNCLGVNNTQNILSCIKLLKDMYKSKKIYVQRVFPVNASYNNYGYYGDWKDVNAAVKQINIATSEYCNKTDRCYYIDATKGFSSNAVLIASKSPDGLHIDPSHYKDYIKNIHDAVANASNISTDGGTDNNATEGYTPIIKNLLPNTVAGKSYKTTGFEQKFIIIHNMGGGTNKTSYNFWANGSSGRNTSAHYCVEPTEIWQVLEDTWVGHHIGSGKAGNPGYDAGARNSNSFGIEMADADTIDKEAALENTIELTRYLMKTYNIPLENIYNHQQVSGASHTDCPWWILKNNKWDYFLEQVKTRNENNQEIKLNSGISSGGNGSGVNGVGTLPEFDNREDLVHIEKVKGVVLVNMPPHHFYSKKAKTEEWEKESYDRNFHFEVDSAGFKTKVDNTLITWGMQPNDKHTYIDRALFKNKPYKYVLNIGLFTSEGLQDYTVTEKILIDKIGKVLWDNGLETKDLWREFDLNRAPSPFMYLEREQWKKFLREVDKQVQWRYENFGTPPVIAEQEEHVSDGDSEIYKDKVGKTAWTNRQCSLWKNPEENIDDRVTILAKNMVVNVTDYDEIGMYKVELVDNNLKGWIWATSLSFEEKEEETDEELPPPTEVYLRNKAARDKDEEEDSAKDDNEDSDPEEDKSGEKNIPQPEIIPTMTHEEYLKWKEFTDPKLIDNFAGSCEPYDKGLDEILNAPITEDDRLNALTEQLDTRNENTIYFNCVEGSPGGDGSHCAKNANELNMLIKPDPYNVDPIYPDLIIPPNYSTVDYNVKASNALPLTVLQEQNGTIQTSEDYDSNNLFFDFNLLKDKEKKSKGKPINYLDPYPYDDKIFELENHKPKVKIDEIEARLYDSNHPGDPVAHPIAKNFANVYDMAINQSKKIESRLVRIENTLATVLRNLGRIGSRININCVYYGGQDVFGKYRTIRCMRDDRIHDAGSMTLDQCLCCTRYEPIVGQIYEILDDTGVNGSVMLDNMQMSYMNLDDMKNLNRVEERNSTKKFVNVNREEKETPKKMLDEWENIDQNAYLDKMKKNITSDEELTNIINNMKQEDYAFKMNWLETDLDLQEPDVKIYPTEGIKAKYKTPNGETPIEDNSISADLGGLTDTELGYDTEADKELIDDTDLDYQEDLDKLDKINQGEWVDTREEADTFEKNIYTSEDYYFEGFNSEYSTFYPGGSSGFGAEARNKIVEMAKQIVQDHLDAKACYSNAFRTVDYTNPQYGHDSKISTEKIVGYDCSSLVSCCYNHAGLKEITNKLTAGIYEYAMSKKDSGAKVWDANMDSIKQAKPGDIIVTKGSGHAGIYIGDNQFAHASSNKYELGKQIRIDPADNFLKYCITDGIFLTPADLVKADEETATGGIENPDFSGGDVAEQIFNFVKSQGGSDACAAGIVGNAFLESSFDPTLVNYLGCAGLFQVYQDRFEGLKSYAASKGKQWTDAHTQIEWMWMEVTNTKPAGHFVSYNLKLKGYTLEEFKNMTSPEEAAALFEHFYEIAGNKSKYCPLIKKGKSCRYCGSTPRSSSDKAANIRETAARSAYNKYALKQT